MKIEELKVDKSWTLFLDRDGVINLHYPNDYVKNWDEFYFLEGVLDALKSMSVMFRRILIVTNQQGVGKGVMGKADLEFIHTEMIKEVRKYGGRIHAVYSATDLKEKDLGNMRKPATGMAKHAKSDFPEIDFAKSIVVGDSVTDMQFGKSSGMITVFIGDESRLSEEEKGLVDIYCDSLREFANSLTLSS